MPTFDFVCEDHGSFEIFNITYTESYPCKVCGKPAQQEWRKFPSMDPIAFGMWNNFHDDDTGATYTDKNKYYADLDRRHCRIKEPGSDEAAERIAKQETEKQMKEIADGIGEFYASHTIDELKNRIAVDAEIAKAQQQGNENKLKSMGAVTSLDEAYQMANKDGGLI